MLAALVRPARQRPCENGSQRTHTNISPRVAKKGADRVEILVSRLKTRKADGALLLL